MDLRLANRRFLYTLTGVATGLATVLPLAVLDMVASGLGNSSPYLLRNLPLAVIFLVGIPSLFAGICMRIASIADDIRRRSLLGLVVSIAILAIAFVLVAPFI